MTLSRDTYKPTYTMITTLGDFGPWISKIILNLPVAVGVNDITTQTFNVFCQRTERADGSVLLKKAHGSDHAAPVQGYITARTAYPSDVTGKRLVQGTYVTLELPEDTLTKRINSSILASRYTNTYFRITQLKDLPGSPDPISGLVFDECTADTIPALARWHEARMEKPVDGIQMEYGYYEPDFDPTPAGPFGPAKNKPQKAALLIYLHGAGEGKGTNIEGGPTVEEGPSRAYTGNRVTALSQNPIQGYFDGAAWVLVPQCPTYWMDNGEEQLGHSNKTIYTTALKALIDEFIAAHADHIDTSRIIIAGLSNGGFMTVRMCIDYPDFFAAGLPCCAPYYQTDDTLQEVKALTKTPLWFTHSKGDELVPPTETVLPLYRELKAAGATVYMTYFDHVEDLTGVYRNPDGSPKKTFNHGVWINQFNDFCRTDIDDTNVMIDFEPVGLWEWAARQTRA